jgi:hypothetical protein
MGKSEYGNPSVVIETPKVLKRIDLTVPKEGFGSSRICNLVYGIVDNFT